MRKPRGFLLLDLNGTVLDANSAASELLGWRAGELRGRSLTELIHPAERASNESDLALVLSGTSLHYHDQVRLVARDGGEVPVELNVRTVSHREPGSVCAVAELEGNAGRPRGADRFSVAHRDSLTKLPNRDRFLAELDGLLDAHSPAAVTVIGVDRLGDLKARHGHRAGTAAVLATARLLQAHAGGRDGLARIGEDEFALLLANASTEQAMELASHLLEISRGGPDPSARRALSLSIGIFATGDHAAPADELLERAEGAMRQVRSAGGDSYAVGRARLARASPLHAVPEHAQSDSPIDLDPILEAVAELGGASLGLVAWDLYVSERAVAPAWSLAIRRRLLKRARFDPEHREWLYDLTPIGRSRLRRPVSRPGEAPSAARADADTADEAASSARAQGRP